jgi:hypothetical protein
LPAQLAPLVRQDLLVLTAQTARPVPPALPVPLARQVLPVRQDRLVLMVPPARLAPPVLLV